MGPILSLVQRPPGARPGVIVLPPADLFELCRVQQYSLVRDVYAHRGRVAAIVGIG